MPKEYDFGQVQQFVLQSNGYGVDAIVVDPNNSGRVATENICTSFGRERAEFVLAALNYYRQHKIIEACREAVTIAG
jgi:hypothetical protein